MKKLLNKKGFTLIELIVVIAILAILALILIPSILNYIGEANRAKDQANARSTFSEVALVEATRNPVRTLASVTVANPPSGLVCVYSVDAGEVDKFVCLGNGYEYRAPNFVPTTSTATTPTP